MKLFYIILLLPIILLLDLAEARQTQWLHLHNEARKQVGLSPLKWDKKLAKYAKGCGYQRRHDCATLVHSTGPYGENMFWGAGDNWTPAQAVRGWVSEKLSYNNEKNTCAVSDCGHYTQIVWRSTNKRVGCARVVCDGENGVLYVCEYDPPGNFFGDRPY